MIKINMKPIYEDYKRLQSSLLDSEDINETHHNMSNLVEDIFPIKENSYIEIYDTFNDETSYMHVETIDSYCDDDILTITMFGPSFSSNSSNTSFSIDTQSYIEYTFDLENDEFETDEYNIISKEDFLSIYNKYINNISLLF